MLSYRHAIHAGNFADIHKHMVLSLLMQSLQRTDLPYIYLDTHAGAGCYDLLSAEAQKNAEYRNGIQHLWGQTMIPEVVRPYLAAIQTVNPRHHTSWPRFYPGSPRVARYFLRAKDRMILTELHPEEFLRLRQEFTTDLQVSVFQMDGYLGIKSHLPPLERCGLVFIDPTFEQHGEAIRLISELQTAH